MTGPLAGMLLSVTGDGPGTVEAAALLSALGASPDTGDRPVDGADARIVLQPPSQGRGRRDFTRTGTIAQGTGLAAAAWEASRLRIPDGVVESLLGAWLAVDALARAIAERRGLPAPRLAPANELVLASIGPSLADAAAGRASRALGGGLTPPMVVECSDGAVFVGVASDEDWQVLAGVVGDARLADPTFVTASGRRSHRAEAGEVLGAWACQRSRSEIVSLFTDLRLPVAPTWTLTEAITDPPLGSRVTATLPFELDADASSGRSMSPGSPRGGGRWSDTARRPSSPGPLTGHLVLDFSSLVAGPLAGRILADLGATVLKIEAPGRPDGTRGSGGGPRSTFELLNRGKDSLTLDLREESGRRQLESLLAMADLGMDSFSPRVLPSLGMPVHGLLASGARPAWLSITGYGLDGEYRDRVALDATASCVAGLVKGAVLRGASCSTQPFGWPLVDTLTGLHASVAATALLLARSIGRPSSWMGCALVDSGLLLAQRLEETGWRSSAGAPSAAWCSVTDIAAEAVRASPWLN